MAVGHFKGVENFNKSLCQAFVVKSYYFAQVIPHYVSSIVVNLVMKFRPKHCL